MIYNLDNWQEYCQEFDLPETIKNKMKSWTIKDFQNFFDFKGIDQDGNYIK